MPKSRARKHEEWTGGVVLLEGAGLRGNDVSTLMWIDARGAVVGRTAASDPDEVLAQAADLLRQTIASSPARRRPARVRVATQALADALAELGPSIEIVCAATPEVDAVAKLLRAELDRRRESSYLAPGVEPVMMAKLFGALADLYRAAPWTIVPPGRETFSLGIRELGVDDGVVAVFGQPGDGFGLMFFASHADHRAFVDTGGVAAGRLGAPWHMAVHFERGADILAPMRKEIAEHGWDVADPHAYPWIVVSDANNEQRRYTAREVLWIESTARALVWFLERRRDELEHAWATGVPWARQAIVDTFAGRKDVDLGIDAAG